MQRAIVTLAGERPACNRLRGSVPHESARMIAVMGGAFAAGGVLSAMLVKGGPQLLAIGTAAAGVGVAVGALAGYQLLSRER